MPTADPAPGSAAGRDEVSAPDVPPDPQDALATTGGRIGLILSGYVLTGNAIAASGFGFLFWVVAAKRYAAVDVGLGSAVVSAVMVVSGIGAVGLASALPRFVPVTPSWVSLVLRGYAVAAGATLALALAACLVLGSVTDELSRLLDPGWLVLFCVAAVAWTLFALQDYVLIARRRPVLMAGENLVVALARIALLFVPAFADDAAGLLVAWLLPTVVAVVAINHTVLRGGEDTAGGAPPDYPVIRRYAAVATIGTTASVLAVSLMPLLVTAIEGAEANARFFLPWSVTVGLQAVAAGMASPLLPAIAGGHGREREATLRVLWHTCAVTGALAVPIAILGPWALGLLGPDYEVDEALLLLLLAGSLLASATFVLLTRLRAHSRVAQVAVVQWVITTILVGVSVAFLAPAGVVAVGWAFLAAQIAGLLVALRDQRLRGPAAS